MQRAEIVEEYRIEDLGAPFSVVLERSVGIVQGEHGPSPIIPDLPGLVYETTLARARHPRRLTGPDLLFLRRAVEMSREDFGRAMGCTAIEIEAYEDGERAIPAPLDGLARLHAYHRIKHEVPGGIDRMIDFMGWLFDEHRYNPIHAAGEDISFILHYESASGWTLCGIGT